MKKVIFGLTIFVSAISRLVEGVEAHAWTSFRDGGIGSSREAVVPTEWSPEKGILWQIETRGYGQSSPLLWNDIIYITYVYGPYKDLSVVAAIDLTTGLFPGFATFRIRPTGYTFRIYRLLCACSLSSLIGPFLLF